MDKYIETEQQLIETGIAELLLYAGSEVESLIEKGELSGCKVQLPVWSDGPMLKNLNDVLGTKADYMYYILVQTDNSKSKTLEDIKKEASKLVPIIEKLDGNLEHEDGTKGVILNNNDLLLHINSVTIKYEDNFVHSIFFLLKSAPKIENIKEEELKHSTDSDCVC